MRLHLVSLALLLLALCRPSSSAASAFSSAKATTKTSTSITLDEKKAEAAKVSPELAAKTDAIEEFMGNSLYAIILDVLGMYKDLPKYYKDALNNGILCEFEKTPNLDAKIKQTLYGTFDANRRTAEVAMAKTSAKSWICPTDAGANLVDAHCFCNEGGVATTDDKKKSLLYCRAKELKDKITKDATHVKQQCFDDAFKALEDVAPKYAEDLFKESSVSAIVPDEANAAIGQYFCEASSDKIEEAIKKVYAADAKLWTLDAILTSLLAAAATDMTNTKDVDVSCKDGDPFKESPFGKCVCSEDKGIIVFCLPHLIGKKLKDDEYLVCPAQSTPGEAIVATYVEAKKPAALPEVMKASGGGITKTPTNVTDTTTEPSSAATSSLLLAAAVVLLGQ